MQGVQKHTTVQSWRTKITYGIGETLFKKSSSYLKILDTKRGDMKLVPYGGTTNTRRTAHRFVARANWRPGFAHPM